MLLIHFIFSSMAWRHFSNMENCPSYIWYVEKLCWQSKKPSRKSLSLPVVVLQNPLLKNNNKQTKNWSGRFNLPANFFDLIETSNQCRKDHITQLLHCNFQENIPSLIFYGAPREILQISFPLQRLIEISTLWLHSTKESELAVFWSRVWGIEVRTDYRYSLRFSKPPYSIFSKCTSCCSIELLLFFTLTSVFFTIK